MPQPVAEAVEPASVVERADIVVHIEIGDVANLRNLQAPPPWANGSAADLQRAEAGREVTQLHIAETLIAKHHNGVAVYRGPERIRRCGVKRLVEIEAADLGDERTVQRTRLDRHADLPCGCALHCRAAGRKRGRQQRCNSDRRYLLAVSFGSGDLQSSAICLKGVSVFFAST
jgi:hypothetical protein